MLLHIIWQEFNYLLWCCLLKDPMLSKTTECRFEICVQFFLVHPDRIVQMFQTNFKHLVFVVLVVRWLGHLTLLFVQICTTSVQIVNQYLCNLLTITINDSNGDIRYFTAVDIASHYLEWSKNVFVYLYIHCIFRE